jgi:hypothetical protein
MAIIRPLLAISNQTFISLFGVGLLTHSFALYHLFFDYLFP